MLGIVTKTMEEAYWTHLENATFCMFIVPNEHISYAIHTGIHKLNEKIFCGIKFVFACLCNIKKFLREKNTCYGLK